MKAKIPAGKGFPRMNHRISIGVLALAAGASAFFLWPNPLPVVAVKRTAKHSTLPSAPTPDPYEPAEDFDTFLHVLQTGGSDATRPAAIAWLDRCSRENLSLPEAHSARLMEMIADGGHPSWRATYRQHIFNSAFNALHRCDTGESLTIQLLRLALHDSDRTMRLYALQHIGAQRRAGHLPDSPLAEKVLSAVRGLAERDEDVSGYAIDLMASWEGGENSEPAPSVRDLALATAADTARSVDIRVTALHAAGSASLPLARVLAAKPEEHVMLRKATISLIGKYGSAEDLASLESLRTESSRLSQAAEPAIAMLRKARKDAPAATLIRY